MNPGGKAALAVGAGYVIGRQHKLRAVLMLGAAAATGRMLGSRAAGQQNGDDQADGGAGLPGKVGGAGKSAAISAFERSADRIGERLSEMATSIRGEAAQQDGSGDGDAGADDDTGNGAEQPQASTDENDEAHADKEGGEAGGDSEGAEADKKPAPATS